MWQATFHVILLLLRTHNSVSLNLNKKDNLKQQKQAFQCFWLRTLTRDWFKLKKPKSSIFRSMLLSV